MVVVHMLQASRDIQDLWTMLLRMCEKSVHTYYIALCVFSEISLLDVVQGIIVLVILENDPRSSLLQIHDSQ